MWLLIYLLVSNIGTFDRLCISIIGLGSCGNFGIAVKMLYSKSHYLMLTQKVNKLRKRQILLVKSSKKQEVVELLTTTKIPFSNFISIKNKKKTLQFIRTDAHDLSTKLI